MTLETRVLDRVKHALTEIDSSASYFFKTTGGTEPDLVGSVRGRSVVCEVKQPGQKPRPAQLLRLRIWAITGAVAVWTDGGPEWYRILPSGAEKTHSYDALKERILYAI